MSNKTKFILKRIIISLVTILFLISITFILMHMLPGEAYSGQKILPEEVKAAINTKYGLDKPILEQFFIYLSNLIQGDFGISLVSKRSVLETIQVAFPVSLELGVRALIFVFTFGLFIGSYAAIKRGKGFDKASTVFTLIGISLPSFITAALLQYFLGLKLYELTGIHFFKVIGWSGETSKILPAFALAFGAIASTSRLMRNSMIDVLNQDYILTAKAKGISSFFVVWRHCLKNAFLPLLSYFGPFIATVLTGTFVIENIFSIPGLGRYFVTSIQNNDYPMIIGLTLFFGIFLIFCNLVIDFLCVLFDPRIQIEQKKGDA